MIALNLVPQLVGGSLLLGWLPLDIVMMVQCGTKDSLEVGDIPNGSVVSYRGILE